MQANASIKSSPNRVVEFTEAYQPEKGKIQSSTLARCFVLNPYYGHRNDLKPTVETYETDKV